MKQFRFSACLIAVLTICLHSAAGQANVPIAQAGPGVAKNGGARATNARPNGSTSRNVGRGPVGTSARTAYSRPTGAQRSMNSRGNYSASARPLNSTLAAMSARQSARTYNAQPVPGPLAKNDVVESTLPMPNAQPAVKTDNLQPTSDDLARRQMSERPVDTQRITRPDDLQPTKNIPAREDITESGPATPVKFTGQLLMSDRRVRRDRANRGMRGMATSSAVAFPTHFAAIATNGTIAIGGSKIAVPSFLLTADIISWMQVTGIRPGATIRLTAITTTMGRFTLTGICCPIR